jgi:hypothetical protein
MNAKQLIDALRGSPETAAQAALDLWTSPEGPNCGTQPDLCSAIRSSVADGNHSAAALLLLGYDASEAATEALKRLAATGQTELTRLHPWSETIPVRLPADVALSRLGDPDARARLFSDIEAGGLSTLAFLVEVLRDIDAPEVLQTLSRVLNDDREVPVGPTSEDPINRRLKDVAIEAFVARLGLGVSFELDSNCRYSEENSREVLAQIRGSVPQ